MTSPDPAPTPKAVFLDAAGTLFESVKPVAVTYAELARQYGKDVPSEEVSRRFRECFAGAPPMAFPEADAPRLEALERGWWHDVVWNVFETTGPFPRFDDYFAALFAYFARADSWMLFDDAETALKGLRARGFILVMISNFDSRVLKIIRGLGIADYFDSVFISSSAGFAKPAAGIFQLALERHGIVPHEAVHVGDSPETDVEGARNAGVRPVLLDRNGGLESDGTARIRGLGELMSLL
ncbi:MAG: HAD-IA family hydrolase [Deltaproteobacteria bacterium]|nr:HAD-IA family hydrolase [Deltaproteobacteria bacterium]